MKKPFADSSGAPRRFFSPERVAEALGLHKRTVLRMVQRKELEAYQPTANCIRIPEDAINKLLASRSIGQRAEQEAPCRT